MDATASPAVATGVGTTLWLTGGTLQFSLSGFTAFGFQFSYHRISPSGGTFTGYNQLPTLGSGSSPAPTILRVTSSLPTTAGGSGSTPSPTIAATAAGAPPVSTGSGSCPTPTISAVVAVAPVAATGAGSAPDPFIFDGSIVNVAAETATGSGSAPLPVALPSATAPPTVAVGLGLSPAAVPLAVVASTPAAASGSGAAFAPTLVVTFVALPATAVGFGSTHLSAVFTEGFEPLAVVALKVPRARNLLGVAQEYEAFVVDRSLGSILTRLPWDSITWGRKLSDFSEASVRLPLADLGRACRGGAIEGLKAWRYGLRVERDGELVHTGPIVNIARPEGTWGVEVMARDVSAWTGKRIQRFDRSGTKGAAAWVLQAISDAFAVDDIPISGVNFRALGAGPDATRAYYAKRLQKSYEVLQELVSSAGVDYTVVGDTWYFGDFTALENPIGLLTDDAFAASPGMAVDGLAQANTVFVTGEESDDQGFTSFGYYQSVIPEDGVLEEVFPEFNADSTPDSIEQLDAAAQDYYRLAATGAPTISAGKLSPVAPMSIHDLIPGVLVQVDALETALWDTGMTMRITSVDVSVVATDSGLTEDVGVTLQSELPDVDPMTLRRSLVGIA